MGKAHAWVKRLKTADRTRTGERSFAREALSLALVTVAALIAISMLLIASAFAQADPAFAEQEPTATEMDWAAADAAPQSAAPPSATPLQAQAENTLASVNGRNWMSKLPDSIPVSSICIPGTHDSATMWTKLPGGLSAVQDQTIGEWSYPYVNFFGEESIERFDGQLNAGVRYFDLRLSVKTAGDTKEHAGELYLLHGYHWNEAQLCTGNYALAPGDYKTLYLDGDGEDLNHDGLDDGVWPWFEDFLRRNPTETLIVEFTDEYDGKKAEAYEFFKKKALEGGSRIWRGKRVPTLGEARGRIILFANLGGSYGRDKFKLSDGSYWAFPVNWGPGSETYGVEKCGEYGDIELWGQNTYEGIYAKAKQYYVLNGIAYETEGGGLYARSATIRDRAIAKDMNAWIVNFASGNSPMKKGLWHTLIMPRDYHVHTVKEGIMGVHWLKDDYLQGYWQNQSKTGVFTGILPMDFVNADIARFVYRINYYSYGPPEYTWTFTDDLNNLRKTTCTATRSIMGDRSKSQSVESVALHVYSDIKKPSCTEPGSIRYRAYFPTDASWAPSATTTQNVPALGHHYEYASGNETDTIAYKCSRCDKEVSLTLSARSRQYGHTTSFYPLHDCTLGNVDTFNAAMGTNLYLNNVKLYKDDSEVQKAQDAGVYDARVYIDETHYVQCTFEITPQEIEPAVRDFSKEYGEPEPNYKAELWLPDLPTAVRDSITVTREPGENIGTYKLVISMPDDPNYRIRWDTNNGRKVPELTITKRRITISKIAAHDKVYDGTTVATLKPEGATFAYKDTGEEFKDPNLSFSVPCSFVHQNVNENAAVKISSVDDLKLVGPNANNYFIENKYADIVDNGTATISPRPVKVWALAQSVDEGDSIVEFGSENAIATGTGAEESGLAEGDVLSFVHLSAERPTGSTITGITPSGARFTNSSGDDVTHNYRIEYGEGIAYVHNAVTGVPTATSYTYDGAEHELLTCNDPNVQYSRDGVSWSSDIPRSRDAGSWTVYWRIGESGETASLYTSIERRPVLAIPTNNVSKTYGDSDPYIEALLWFNNQPLPGHKLSGVSRMPGENVGTYRYDAGSIKVLDTNNGNADVTSNYRISFLPQAEGRVFTINPRPVTVSGIAAETKVYDGTTAAVADTSTATLDGVLEFDRITVTASAQFADKAAGENKTVNLSDLTLHGENVSNYVLATTAQQAWTTARIVPKPIGVSGIIVENEGAKVYDGTNEIALDVSGATFDKIGDDDLSVSAVGTLADPNVGSNKNVALRLTGADKDNYEVIVTGPNTRYTARVTPRPVTVTGITAEDKVYDGTTEVTLDFTNAGIEGVLDGDKDGVSLSGAETIGEFEDANVGEDKTVTIVPVLEGEAADNYIVANDTSLGATAGQAATGRPTTGQATAGQGTAEQPTSKQATTGQAETGQTTTASITKRPLVITAFDQILEDGQEPAQGIEQVYVEDILDSSGNLLPDQGLVDGQYLGGISLTADNAAGTVTPGQAQIYADDDTADVAADSGDDDTAGAPEDNTGDDTADAPVDYAANYRIEYRSGVFKPCQFILRPEGRFWVFDGMARELATPGEAVGGRKMQYYVELISDSELEAAGEGGESADGGTDEGADAEPVEPMGDVEAEVAGGRREDSADSGDEGAGVEPVEALGDIETQAAGEDSGGPDEGTDGGDEGTEWMDDVAWQNSMPTAKDAGLYCIVYRAADATGTASVEPDYDYTFTYVAPKVVEVTWSSTSFTYNGSPQAPTAKVTGLVGDDALALTVTGAQTNVGTYTATATAPSNENYELDGASSRTTFTIAPADISGASVTLSPTTLTYTGEPLTPAVTVTLGGHVLVPGVDYELSFSDNVGPGTATVTVEGKGNYTGSIRTTFTIEETTPSAVDDENPDESDDGENPDDSDDGEDPDDSDDGEDPDDSDDGEDPDDSDDESPDESDDGEKPGDSVDAGDGVSSSDKSSSTAKSSNTAAIPKTGDPFADAAPLLLALALLGALITSTAALHRR